MNLFVNTISSKSFLAIFNDKQDIIASTNFEIKWNEASLLIPNIETFIKKNNISFQEIKNIVLVNWPWSFTGVRTASLVINTIWFITNANLSAISYFDLFNNYPIIKSSSKRDSFFKINQESQIVIIPNDELSDLLDEKWIKEIYWEWDLKNVKFFEKIDYTSIIKNIKLEKLTRISPLYLKKPNIC